MLFPKKKSLENYDNNNSLLSYGADCIFLGEDASNLILSIERRSLK